MQAGELLQHRASKQGGWVNFSVSEGFFTYRETHWFWKEAPTQRPCPACILCCTRQTATLTLILFRGAVESMCLGR
jgi:hypothetical protein